MGGSPRVRINAVGRDAAGKRYVDLSILDARGREFRDVASLAGMTNDPRALIEGAANAGIVVMTTPRQRKLLRKIEDALNKVDTTDAVDFEVVSKVGWHGQRFVTPHWVYGIQRRKIRAALAHIKRSNRWCPRGDLGTWQQMMATAGRGNNLVIFAACAAFAAPLLSLVRLEGATIVLVGPTRTGKSSLSWLISSVWGGDPNFKTGYMDSWKATVGSLEEIAAQSRDSLLVLDDTQQLAGGRGSRADTLAEAIFTLSSGIQKARLTNEGPIADWRVIVWATANDSMRKILADGGRRYDDSMAARMIELSATRRLGVFDEIPEGFDPASFSKWIVEQSNLHYGEAIDSYLRRLTLDRRLDEDGLVDWVKARMASQKARLGIDGTHGLKDSIGDIFALIYAAGQLARKYGILPWSAAGIRRAVLDIYASYQSSTAHDSVASDPIAYVRNTIERLRGEFVELRDLSDGDSDRVTNALGLLGSSRRGEGEFIFLPEQFERTFGGSFGVDTLLVHLKNAELLKCDKGYQTKRTVAGSRERVYCLDGNILSYGQHSA